MTSSRATTRARIRTRSTSFPSGSVGIPPVVSVYLALAHRYAERPRLRGPATSAHFWSLDRRLRVPRGFAARSMPDAAERQLGNVTWIIDYNRQNLDGTRIPNERGLTLAGLRPDPGDGARPTAGGASRFATAASSALELFERPGGDGAARALRGGLSRLRLPDAPPLQARPGRPCREYCARTAVSATPASRFSTRSSDDEWSTRFVRPRRSRHGAGARRRRSRREEGPEPSPTMLVVAHDQGLGPRVPRGPLQPLGRSPAGGDREAPVRRGPASRRTGRSSSSRPSSEEAKYLQGTPGSRALPPPADRERSRDGAAQQNRERVRGPHRVGGRPAGDRSDIDLSSSSRVAHTQWMWGQLAAKLVRIGTTAVQDARRGGRQEDQGPHPRNEQRWKSVADFLLTMSPDVGTSTNIAPAMDSPRLRPGETERRPERHGRSSRSGTASTRS